MRIHLLSDLHNEFEQFKPDSTTVNSCDVVVLAGDIDKGTRGMEWARRAFRSKPLIYVCGNHEFYDHHWTELLQEMEHVAKRLDIHFLENRAIDIDGVRFLGCTLWTDFRFFRYQSVTSAMRACERGLNDFRLIRAEPLRSNSLALSKVREGKRLTAHHVRLRHSASAAWLREQLRAANSEGKKPVVVTHHLPSERSVSPRYAKDDLTPAFASHLDELVTCARLWIHGHTHDSFDYSVHAGGHVTRVLCNPRGYALGVRGAPVNENASFNPSLIVEC